MMRLGGWWRIWIVLTVVCIALGGVFAVVLWPEPADIGKGYWLTARLHPASRALIEQAPLSAHELISAHRAAKAGGDSARVRDIEQQIQHRRDSPLVEVTASNGLTFALDGNTSEQRAGIFRADLNRAIAEELAARRHSTALVATIYGLGPPLVLLIFGLAVAWIRRGF